MEERNRVYKLVGKLRRCGAIGEQEVFPMGNGVFTAGELKPFGVGKCA